MYIGTQKNEKLARLDLKSLFILSFSENSLKYIPRVVSGA